MHPKVAMERVQPADGLGGHEPFVPDVLAVADRSHPWPRQVVREIGADADGAGSWSAAAMRRRERLVEVEVHDVDAQVAGAGDAQDRVEVGAIVVDQPAGFVYQPDDLVDALVPQAKRVWGW